MTITGAVYPEVAKLLEEIPADERRRALEAEALELLNHPDARFERLPGSHEDRFVTYRDGKVYSVPIRTHTLLEARMARSRGRQSRLGAALETEHLDRLRQEAFLGLCVLLEQE